MIAIPAQIPEQFSGFCPRWRNRKITQILTPHQTSKIQRCLGILILQLNRTYDARNSGQSWRNWDNYFHKLRWHSTRQMERCYVCPKCMQCTPIKRGNKSHYIDFWGEQPQFRHRLWHADSRPTHSENSTQQRGVRTRGEIHGNSLE